MIFLLGNNTVPAKYIVQIKLTENGFRINGKAKTDLDLTILAIGACLRWKEPGNPC